MDVQGFCLRQYLLGMVGPTIVRYHHDRTFIVPFSYRFKEHAHVLRLGVLRELYDQIAPYG